MSKVRINDLARELEVKSREILDTLTAVGVTEKKTHSSSLESDEAERVRAYLKRGSRSASETQSRSAGNGQKPKIDWSQVSKPGDAARELLRRKEEAAAAAASPRPAAPAATPAPPPVAAKPAPSQPAPPQRPAVSRRGGCFGCAAQDCSAAPPGATHCGCASTVGSGDCGKTAHRASDCPASGPGGRRSIVGRGSHDRCVTDCGPGLRQTCGPGSSSTQRASCCCGQD